MNIRKKNLSVKQKSPQGECKIKWGHIPFLENPLLRSAGFYPTNLPELGAGKWYVSPIFKDFDKAATGSFNAMKDEIEI